MDNLKSKWSELQRPVQLAVAALAAVVAIVVIWKVLPALVAAMGLAMFVLLLFVPYWAPTIVAFVRKHPSKGAVLALNFFLGWTFVGWIVSLVWALSDNAVRNGQTIIVNNNVAAGHQPVVANASIAPAAAPQYQVGDVVNGHRFNGVSWTPLAVDAPASPPAAIESRESEATHSN